MSLVDQHIAAARGLSALLAKHIREDSIDLDDCPAASMDMYHRAFGDCLAALHHRLKLSEPLQPHGPESGWMLDLSDWLLAMLGGSVALGFLRSIQRLYEQMMPWTAIPEVVKDCDVLTLHCIHMFLSLEGWTRTLVHDADFARLAGPVAP